MLEGLTKQQHLPDENKASVSSAGVPEQKEQACSVKFKDGPCKEVLLRGSNRNSYRMTPIGGRSRTVSETGLAATTPLTSTLSGTEDCLEVTILDETGDGGRLPDLVAESKLSGGADGERVESYLAITIQVFIPFLVAGLGMVGAGLVLDDVQHWVVFEKVNELMILVPALLGLKGNLEMTLASRLSTQANLGHMDAPR